jgi:glutaredoxin
MNAAPRVALYTIPGRCPLCDEAREVLDHEAIGFAEVDIRTDLALLRAYRDEIPVVVVDGRKLCVGRVDLALLRATLARPPHRSS